MEIYKIGHIYQVYTILDIRKDLRKIETQATEISIRTYVTGFRAEVW